MSVKVESTDQTEDFSFDFDKIKQMSFQNELSGSTFDEIEQQVLMKNNRMDDAIYLQKFVLECVK